MVGSITRISAFSFLLNRILICYCRSQTFEVRNFFKISISYLSLHVFGSSGYEEVVSEVFLRRKFVCMDMLLANTGTVRRISFTVDM
jgi:hypothetical protein